MEWNTDTIYRSYYLSDLERHRIFPVGHIPCGRIMAFYSANKRRAWCRRCQRDVPAVVMIRVLTMDMV